VLFTDRAELLACLASDWLGGKLGERWWWRSLFPEIRLNQGLWTIWTEMPEYVPTALEMLSRWGEVVSLARAAESSVARCLLERLLRCFDLRALQAVLPPLNEMFTTESPSGGEACIETPDIETPEHTARVGFTTIQVHSSAIECPPPPWQALVPESAVPDLHLGQRLLLGIGLSLSRLPQAVRTSAFALAVRASLPGLHPMPPVDSSRAPLPQNSSLSTSMPTPSVSVMSYTQPVDEFDHHQSMPPLTADVSPGIERLHDGQSPANDPDTAPVDLQWSAAVHGPHLAESPTPVSRMFPPLLDSVQAVSPDFEQIETDLGGLFYLINLGLYLHIYGDFTTPLDPGVSLSIWDFVTLVGQQLLDEKDFSDPVWALLTRLAGRFVGQPPGWGFDPPVEWRLPLDWLKPFDEQQWEYLVSTGRLIVRHPAGFSVLDVGLDPGLPNLAEQLACEMTPYAQCRIQKGVSLVEGSDTSIPIDRSRYASGLASWVYWFVEYVRARFCRALGLGSAADLPTCLFNHHASLRLTATHLGITFILTEHPVAIRLAGLDRDPGWVPAAGRFIAYSYE
jgi:hypothetical protein